jgi:hypothetical protein
VGQTAPHHGRRRRLALTRLVAGALLATLVLGTSGCALLGGGHHVAGDASLSEAAAQARPDTTTVRRGRTKERSKPLDVGWSARDDEDESISSFDESGSLAPETAPDEAPSAGSAGLVLGLVTGGGSLGGTSYDGYGMIGIDVGGYLSKRLRVDLIGSVGGVNFTGQSVAGQSFQNEFELALDFTTRYYVTPPHTFTAFYPIGGVRLGTLFWDFAKPITITENGQDREIQDDQVGFLSFYGGAGVAFMQIRHLHVGANLTSGLRIYSWQTEQGFSNDLFPATGFFQLLFETTYKF